MRRFRDRCGVLLGTASLLFAGSQHHVSSYPWVLPDMSSMRNTAKITDLPRRHHHAGYQRYRDWVQTKHPSLQVANKVLITLAGVLVIIVGLILVPLPGPGWLIVFFGLSILGLEFPPIQRFTSWIGAKAKGLWRNFRKRYPSRVRVAERSEPR